MESSDRLQHQRSLGQAGGGYGADYDSLVPTFQFKPGELPMHSPQNRDLALEVADLRETVFNDWIEAAKYQQLMYFRDAVPREDWPDSTIPAHTPYPLYSHIVASVHAEIPLLSEYTISPADKVRGSWRKDPQAFLDSELAGTGSIANPPPRSGTNGAYRWLFSSSFSIASAALSNDIGSTNRNYAVHAKLTSNGWRVAGRYGGQATRRYDEVISPGNKVYYYESYDRYSGPQTIYMGFEEANIPVLAFDGSTRFLNHNDFNNGWHSNNPGLDVEYKHTFEVDDVFDTSNTPRTTGLKLTCENTRWGLRGVDFGGEPVVDLEGAQSYLRRTN